MNSESVLQAYINRIKQNNIEPNKIGTIKACYLNKNGYAVLKSLEPVNAGNAGYFRVRYRNFDKIRAFNNLLIQSGVPTSKIYVCKYFENDYYELQERVVGRPLYKYNSEQICKDALNINCDLNELSKQQLLNVSDYVFNYNLQTIKMLNQAPQEHFDALLKGIMVMANFGIREFDNNGENILYSPKTGFKLVDLDIEQFIKDYVKNKKQPLTEQEKFDCATGSFAEIFENCLYFAGPVYMLDCPLFNEKQISELHNQNVDISKKIYTAIKNNGYSLHDKDYASYVLKSIVGEQNFNLDFGKVISKTEGRKK